MENSPRPDDNSALSSGGKIGASDGPSGKQSAPKHDDAPTALELSSASELPALHSGTWGGDSPTVADLGHSSGTSPAVPLVRSSQSNPLNFVLTPGMLVAVRYEILEVLGVGGMGAVY